MMDRARSLLASPVLQIVAYVALAVALFTNLQRDVAMLDKAKADRSELEGLRAQDTRVTTQLDRIEAIVRQQHAFLCAGRRDELGCQP